MPSRAWVLLWGDERVEEEKQKKEGRQKDVRWRGEVDECKDAGI